jgi:hypothetical protein
VKHLIACTAMALSLSCLYAAEASAIAPVDTGPTAGISPIRPGRAIVQNALEVGPSLELAAQYNGRLAGRLADFLQRHGSRWDVRWDTRGDRAALVQGSGIALIPGHGNALDAPAFLSGPAGLSMDDVARMARGFVDTVPGLLGAQGLDLRLDGDRSSVHGPDGERWFLEFGQYHDGIRVDGAFVHVRIVHGNIVQFGSERIADISLDTRPASSRAVAFATAWRALEFPSGVEIAQWIEPGELQIVPLLPAGESPGERFAGLAGTGYRHALAWRYVFRVHGSESTWQVLVDAHDNTVMDVRDLTVHADAIVSGGVYPTTNTDPEIVVEFPYTAVNNNGAKVTDAFGVYDYTGGTASSTLDGRYFRMDDDCGSISLSNNSTGNLAFGTSGGTDCTTPGVGGAGNTHASRTGFYHLTLINEKARSFLPANNWLQSKVTARMNIGLTCNASWNGSTVNFYRSGAGCSNTGEIAAVFLHEWGHGMDSNSGGSANENASGEALGDTFAFLETRDSCIGPNFRPGVPCRNCTSCTGVRDMADFSLGGARTIATPANVTDNGGIDCDSLLGLGGVSCPYTNPNTGSPYRGPMGYQGHCESYIASGANWDLTQKLVEAHGEAGWAEMDNIWYASLIPSKSAYRVESGGQCNPSAVVNGCGANNWYTVFLAADDDDGNLANGTPNACLIWDAFNAHGIACGTRPECTPVETPDFDLTVAPASQQICPGGSAIYQAQIGSLFGFTHPVTLDVTGEPAGSLVSFGSNPAAPGSSTDITIATLPATAAGAYPLTVVGSASGSGGHVANATVTIGASASTSPALTAPPDDAADVDRRVDFVFKPVPGALSYAVEVATDAAFGTIVASVSGLTATTWTSPQLAPGTRHYWRVSAQGECGPATVSPVFSLVTIDNVCSAPAVAVPDNNVAGITDTLVIDDPSALGGLRVFVDATHTRVGDLVVTLSKGATSVVVLDRPGVPATPTGCQGDDIDARFDDDAEPSAETTCNPTPPAIGGPVQPAQRLDTEFAGEPMAGTWQIHVADHAGQQTGTLREWCLQAKPAESRKVGGSVNGLAGDNLTLALNGGEILPVTTDGDFQFSSGVLDGEGYAVTVATQPSSPNQVCTVENGTGTVAGADVESVSVTCSTLTYSLGGIVDGLSGSGLTLLLNESNTLTIEADGPFEFDPLADGSSYDVIIAGQPVDPEQTCVLTNGAGNIDGAPVDDLFVNCVDVLDDTLFINGFEGDR